MKFWLTVVVGVVVLAAGSTAMVVMNPNMQRTEASGPDATEDPTKGGGAQPIAVAEGPMSDEIGTVAQHTQGQSMFKIRNDGKADLLLQAKKPTCTCTDLFLWNAPFKAADTVPADLKQHQALNLQPGATAYVIARWDTKEKSGVQPVAIPVATSDPGRREITFSIKLNIVQEVGATATAFEFGQLNEGDKTSRYLDLYSPIRDKMDVLELTSSAPFLKARVEPLPKDDVAKLNAKYAVRLVVETNGSQPMGAFLETVAFKTKTTGVATPHVVAVTGSVTGDYSMQPIDQFDFREVTPGSHAPLSTYIFARKLKDGEELRLGAFKPAFLDVKLVRKNPNDPKLKVWVLTAEVKRGAAAGAFTGNIDVLDPSGKVRLVLRTTGIVDAAWSETVATR